MDGVNNDAKKSAVQKTVHVFKSELLFDFDVFIARNTMYRLIIKKKRLRTHKISNGPAGDLFNVQCTIIFQFIFFFLNSVP